MSERTAELTDRIIMLVQTDRAAEAARLLPDLEAASGETVTLDVAEIRSWPVCMKCIGTGELNDASFETRKLSCVTNVHLCA
ncbi:MAG: hypothetical protein ACREUY_06175, partial [Burkholderiales bacterium]